MPERICEPSVNWKHPDGAMLTCSNRTLYKLTYVEKWDLKTKKITINQLDERHREDAFRKSARNTAR